MLEVIIPYCTIYEPLFDLAYRPCFMEVEGDHINQIRQNLRDLVRRKIRVVVVWYELGVCLYDIPTS
jgi:hypothetical protein